MKTVISLLVGGALIAGLGCSTQMHNSDRSTESSKASMSESEKDRQEALDRLDDSAKVLTELMGAEDSTIPEWVLSKAQCVMIVPSMVKGGFVVGGQHGRGAATCRNNGRWSAPQMVTLTGGTWGAQIGGESVDLILVFMGNKGAQELLNNSVKLGGEASVAAGPFGRQASASTDLSVKSQILSYSRSRGLFAGLELGGASVRGDDDSNVGLYGRETTSKKVLSGGTPPPAGAENFLATVRKYFREAVNTH
jgi:SH3 domain-containing YSC84-like protein 1